MNAVLTFWQIRLHPRAVERNGGPGVSDFSLVGGGHALDDFRFVMDGYLR